MTQRNVKAHTRADGTAVRAHQRRAGRPQSSVSEESLAAARSSAAGDAADIAASPEATPARRHLTAEARDIAKPHLKRLCQGLVDLENPIYGAKDHDSIDFDHLRNAYALAEHCADADSEFTAAFRAISALRVLGDRAKLERVSKETLEYHGREGISNDHAQAIRSRHLAEYVLAEFSEGGGPLDDAVRDARWAMHEFSEQFSDRQMSLWSDEIALGVVESRNPEEAVREAFDETLFQARTAFDERNRHNSKGWHAYSDGEHYAPRRAASASAVADIVGTSLGGTGILEEIAERVDASEILGRPGEKGLRRALDDAVALGKLSVIPADSGKLTVWAHTGE